MNCMPWRLAIWAMCGAVLLGLTSVVHAQGSVGKNVLQVIPQNNRLVSSDRILSQMQTRPNRPFSQLTAQDDVRRLMATKWFQDVRIDTQPSETEDGVLVLVRVVELPNVVQDIVYRGAQHISSDNLDETTGLKRGAPLSPLSNQNAVQALKRYYESKGRIWADVKLVEGNKLGDTRVVFDIIEGPEVKVGSIQFVGNSFVGTEQLKLQLASSKAFLGRLGGTYVPQQIDLDISKLQDYYRMLGFHAVKINRQLEFYENYTYVKITFHINEGPRYQVGRVQIEGNKSFSEDTLRQNIELQPGKWYDRQVVQADMARLKAYHGYTGRETIINEKIYESESQPGTVNVHYEIVEREPARVGQIIITGNSVTRDNVIRRQIPLYPGQLLSFPNVQVAQNNLNRLGIFAGPQEGAAGPTVTVTESEDGSPFRDVVVQVQEKPTGSFLVGVGVNSDAGLSGSIVLNERNFDLFNPPTSFEDILAGRAFRGGGQEFRLEAVPGNEFQRYTASFREPMLFDSPWSLANSAYYYTRQFNEYTEQRVGGRMTLGRQLDSLWSVSGSVRLENVTVDPVPSFAPESIREDVGESTLLGLRVGINRDTRDSLMRPTTGSMIDVGYEQILGDYTYPLAIAEATKFWTTYERPDGTGRHVLAMRSQLSVTSDDAPVYERFYAGGFRSMRGFQFRGVGPFENGYNVGGQFAFLNSVEYQIPITANDQFYVVSFLDSGTVENDIAIRDYRVSAGFGLRLVMPMLGPVPIALDFGFPVVKGAADRDQLFSFWLGFFN
ncbi:outer membrane protein assembly factor BamA [Tuwongella immobilis]|uniref:Outer membrane protein assembly factor BamA n=1 Tax=Tuwongella immobilis TaxID=692036 RepID=A0A6C2YTC4_9BACT|nr:outer membrane protein assembly factor BamA [Tuwongella immobilis]VIP04165.1 outer membrane protein assembly protein : Probable outer membrane protein OS=Planctomyces maris DSM 8797 GN=PM8797T_18474 PE=4 SV=1: Surf_Ag_VNR: Surf_Ag_VNR: Surf_Ag_VNR: Surf_Ag_VNR: Surf_Ag_VNR: Bac_surface_Ag [Tuwongella immobilis]VTS05695.1 outer membrane protein assembly protein : Probable outer membrane protein OS=Planctomyces maris DSM 8797 GN=PM8797T_18474 PE=4 SV=1: Surf_Ag_VNR: Surf_Ag_VNR: Surf_Ag_VNR: Sur